MKNAQEKCFVEENDDFQLEEIAPCSSVYFRTCMGQVREAKNMEHSQRHRLMFTLCASRF